MMIENLNAVFLDETERDFCVLDCKGAAVTVSQFQADVRYMREKICAEDASAWLIYCDNTYRFGVGFFALLSLGKTVLISANNKRKWVEQFSNEFDAVLSDEELAFAGKPQLDIVSSGSIQRRELPSFNPEFTGKETVVFFTSGSTGSAKAISKPLISLLNEIHTLENFFGEKMRESVLLASVSHHHIYGLLFKLLWPTVCGRVWLNSQIEYPEQLIAADNAFPGLFFASSPAFLSRLDINLTPIKASAVISSGGPLSFAAARDCVTSLSVLPLEVYGSTETGGIAWRQQSSENPPWRLFDGMMLEQGSDGAMLSSPHIPQQCKWLLDDDLTLLADGRFMLKGRKDRVIKLEEKRVSLTEIEKYAESLGTISRCVAVPVSGARMIIACVVELTSEGERQLQEEGFKALQASWKRALGESLERITIPRKWRIVTEIPVNTQGKIDVMEIQSQFSQASIPGSDQGPSDGMQFPQVLRAHIENNGLELLLAINKELNAFDGHFDKAPIVPGVVQIQWVIGFARAYLHDVLPLGVEVLHSVKFQNVIRPDCEIGLVIKLKNDRLEFIFGSHTGRHSSGKVEFRE